MYSFDCDYRDFICANCGRMYLCCGYCTDAYGLSEYLSKLREKEKQINKEDDESSESESDDKFNDNVELCQFIGCLDTRMRMDSNLKVGNGDEISDTSKIFPPISSECVSNHKHENDEQYAKLCEGAGYINHISRNVDWIINEEIQKITGEKLQDMMAVQQYFGSVEIATAFKYHLINKQFIIHLYFQHVYQLLTSFYLYTGYKNCKYHFYIKLSKRI